METANVQREIEGARESLDLVQPGHVAGVKVRHYACSLGLLPRLADGLDHKVYADGLPAVPSQVDDVGAGATTQVQGTTRRGCIGSFNRLYQLWRRDVGVPGRASPQISQPE